MDDSKESPEDDLPENEGQLPIEGRLGNRMNLNQMQSVAAAQISDDVVRARREDETGRVKSLSIGASAAGGRVHTLPTKPRTGGPSALATHIRSLLWVGPQNVAGFWVCSHNTTNPWNS